MRDMNRGFELLGAKIDSLHRSAERRLKLLEKAVDVHENRFQDMDRAARGLPSDVPSVGSPLTKEGERLKRARARFRPSGAEPTARAIYWLVPAARNPSLRKWRNGRRASLRS